MLTVQRLLEGAFDDFLIEIFVKLNFMSFLSTAYDHARNGAGGPKSRSEDRVYFIKQIIVSLKAQRQNKLLAKFYDIVTKMGTWKKMCELTE